MTKQVTCPVCDMQWEGVERCPCDGWELGEKWVLTPDPEAYERAYRERLERAREAMAQFKAGALGSGEEGLQQLRERLQALGLEPGPALEEWARQNLLVPFGGDCCLAITTSEEAEVFIDGRSVGTTRDRYLLVEKLKPGKHRVEAKTRYGYGVVEVELAPGDVQQCEIKLQRGQGFLRVLSEVGVLTLKVDGRSYQVPARIEVEAGRKLLRVRNLLYEAEVEVLPGQTVEVRVTPEWLQDRVKELKGHKNLVHSVAFSPDGQMLASGSNDWTIRLWRVSDGECLATLQQHKEVLSVAFSPDGQMLASGSADNTIRLWRVSDGKCLATVKQHKDLVLSVAFSPDGRLLASGSADGNVCLWRVSDFKCVAILEGHGLSVNLAAPDLRGSPFEHIYRIALDLAKSVNSVAFSPDGRLLASGSNDRTIRLWRVSDGNCLATVKGHTGLVLSVAFSPDGQMLASGSADNTIRLWRVSDGKCLATVKGHTRPVTSVTFSPDGQLLASGSEDNTIRLWRVSDGKCLATLNGHTDCVYSVAFSPDGRLLASGSNDDTIRLWQAKKLV